MKRRRKTSDVEDEPFAHKLVFDHFPKRGCKAQVVGIIVDHEDHRGRCLVCDREEDAPKICHHCKKNLAFWDEEMLVAGFAKRWLSRPWRKQWIAEVDEEMPGVIGLGKGSRYNAARYREVR